MNKVKWLDNAVFYNIFPPSYYDTNGDGIGDLNGIREKLSYIQYMGFNALWLNPFYASPFRDAGYDVSDFYKVAPRYGTNDDFVALCKQAHEMGIKVCIDLVGGHTSIDHPWFQESAKPEPNEFTHRYIWTDDWCKDPKINFVGGYSDRNGCYMHNFFYVQPALNYGFAKIDDPAWQLPMDDPRCRATKQALLDIMDFWINLGCDGFRVDQAPLYVKNDPDGSGNRKFWNEIRAIFDEKYPEHVLIAEWGDPAAALPAGYHVDFLTHCYYKAYTSLLRADKNRNVYDGFPGASFFDEEGDGDIQNFLEDYLELRRKTENLGYIAIPTGNHDLPRYSIGRSDALLKVICAFVMTMPGVPFVYYGDEIGMRYNRNIHSKEGGYNRTGSRTPMQWTPGKNLGFSEGRSEDLYLPVDASSDAPNVEDQLADENSLLHTVKKLVDLRKTQSALLADGAWEILDYGNKGYPLVYLRSGKCIVALNPTGREYTISLAEKGITGDITPLLIEGGAKMTATGLYLPKTSFYIGMLN